MLNDEDGFDAENQSARRTTPRSRLMHGHPMRIEPISLGECHELLAQSV